MAWAGQSDQQAADPGTSEGPGHRHVKRRVFSVILAEDELCLTPGYCHCIADVHLLLTLYMSA